MTQATQAEPPSWFRPSVFMIGQNSRGKLGGSGSKRYPWGLFVDRDAAFRFVRTENGYHPAMVVVVSESIDLKVSDEAPLASLAN